MHKRAAVTCGLQNAKPSKRLSQTVPLRRKKAKEKGVVGYSYGEASEVRQWETKKNAEKCLQQRAAKKILKRCGRNHPSSGQGQRSVGAVEMDEAAAESKSGFIIKTDYYNPTRLFMGSFLQLRGVRDGNGVSLEMEAAKKGANNGH